ncbi:hypothetical protein [Natrinema halophilum]|uniref:Uncharacterized protein n=1 Tax=Natrinema halophilum TaxID=1699371 RepID=A0A7D5KQ35_9EURY|nr:hypothetical protein [Natrinema halophilum]QLG47937.1 hypothetical protein HYG82_03300 [Natrinema halophilum]
MPPWEDERAVTVQIGAVLMLAIVFAALAMYQVNAVPAQNHAIESDHNQRVHNEMLELRNAIRNVGSDGGSKSVSVTLGAQYPSRTFTANPPDPSGTLKTTGTGNVTVSNADVQNSSEYDENPDRLVGMPYESTTLVYRPDYNEYRDAPATRIEHGFAYNDFEEATIPLSGNGVISDGTIRLVLLNGSVSEAGRGGVSLDPEILSGPNDPVPVTSDGSGNITLSIPTRSPSAWNETIGTTFDDGESDARVVAYADGTLRIELAKKGEPYDLQMARVGVGDHGASNSDFDVERRGSESGSSPAYSVDWQDPSGQSSVVDSNCTDDSCVVTGTSVDLTMGTNATADGATVRYAVSDQNVGNVSPTEGTTNSSGMNTTMFTVNSSATDGDTVAVYTSSGSDGDKISLEISRSGPSLESATGRMNTEHTKHGLRSAEFTWNLSNRGDIDARIRDQKGGTVVGNETITNAATSGSTIVQVKSGSNQGGAEPYPVWLEVEVRDTGEVCGAQLSKADGTVDLCN